MIWEGNNLILLEKDALSNADMSAIIAMVSCSNFSSISYNVIF